MAELNPAIEDTQFATSLNLVKGEVVNALDQAASQLDLYSDTGTPENLRSFLEEVQQVRGTFKLLDFRAGERLCEEFADTGRSARGGKLPDSTLSAFTQAIIFLKRLVDLMGEGAPVSPSLLVPAINQIRRERNDAPLPESYFFLVNLRPRVDLPKTEPGAARFPYRRARQMFQLGLLGLIRGQSRAGAIKIMQRAVGRFERASRGGASWLFWHAASAALDALTQDEFEMTGTRLALLGQLDRQVRKIQETEGRGFAEKQPDWLLKEFIHIVSLAQPSTDLVRQVQEEFHVGKGIKETQLIDLRSQLRGPDSSALASLAIALQEELQSIKDQIDLIERMDIAPEEFKELVSGLRRISDTLSITNHVEAADRANLLAVNLEATGMAGLRNRATFVADEVIKLEQSLRTIGASGIDKTAAVDPVSLNEAKIAILSESMAALGMVKRAIGSYLESAGDKLHVRNVSKSLLDVAGAMLFLERQSIHDILLALRDFIENQVLAGEEMIEEHKMEAFADAITAVEYYIDSMNTGGAGSTEAVKLAQESLRHLIS
ncbi:hypothetical protein [Oceanobacter mangrovi]|uniref:hypothetical protein n=1 Tax=Oceanobacter mangrovi TaxID=2862510 RepID=UPI001C8E11DA|nr:hypothetical protein [Oceanobacter mangrovi]